ncbi:MAG: zf-HC2 domain-containing protein [Candidatus Latescibacteria bacterium]|nr:zf-HC2 domain-containing protein [Candidatus Latescibacterota bacterium]
MNCFTCERHLSAYIDDELPAPSRRELETHLDECPRCRAEFEAHQIAWEAAHQLRAEAAPEGLWEAIASHLEKPAESTRLDDLALMLRGLAAQVQDLQRSVDGLRQDMEEAETWPADQGQVRQGIRVRANPFVPGPSRESSIERFRQSS